MLLPVVSSCNLNCYKKVMLERLMPIALILSGTVRRISI